MAQRDSSYKLLFSHREMVADLIRAFVHEDWAAGLDLDTLQRVRESGITQDLREHEDDVIWRLRIVQDGRECWLYLYLILEFQSTVDRAMAVRLLTYVGLLYEDLLKSGEIGPGDPLPPVLPVVIYNGSDPWTAKTDLAEMIDPSLPKELARWQPPNLGSRFAIFCWKSAATARPTWRVCPMPPPPCSGWRTPAPPKTSNGSSVVWSNGWPDRRTPTCAAPSSSGSSACCSRPGCPGSRSRTSTNCRRSTTYV